MLYKPCYKKPLNNAADKGKYKCTGVKVVYNF